MSVKMPTREGLLIGAVLGLLTTAAVYAYKKTAEKVAALSARLDELKAENQSLKIRHKENMEAVGRLMGVISNAGAQARAAITDSAAVLMANVVANAEAVQALSVQSAQPQTQESAPAAVRPVGDVEWAAAVYRARMVGEPE